MKLQISDLDQMQLLEGLGPVIKQELLTHFHVRTYAKNESVVQKGLASAELYFLVSGRLKVVDFIQSGREIGFVFISPGMHFGELALIDGRPRSASIIATEPSIVLVLPKKQAQQLIFEVPHVSKKLLLQLTDTIRKDNEHIILLGSGSAFCRIYRLLLQQMERVDGEAIIERTFTQHEMAIMTNTTRETVSRAISQLQGMGVVKKEGKRLMVQKIDALKHLSIDV
jgi:CRP/FNR family cyclic AMP-dependent transcriptional regulator